MSEFAAFFDERPYPKGRPRFVRGKAVTPTATREYEATLRYWMATEAKACGWTLTEGDVRVCIRLFFDSSGKRPGDVDNYAKSITDAANGVLYRDDSQIQRLTVERVPGATADGFWLTVSHAGDCAGMSFDPKEAENG